MAARGGAAYIDGPSSNGEIDMARRRSRCATACVFALVAACAAVPPAGAPMPLEGTYWKLVTLRGTVVPAAAPGHEPHLVLRAAARRVSGSGGCNRVAGSYTLEGSLLRFGPAAGTRMACPAGMDVEAAFLAMLGAVAGWRIAGDRLELLDASGAIVAQWASGSERYACDGGTELLVNYDDADPQRPQAWVSLDGIEHRLLQVPAASGARYAAEPGRRPGSVLEWSTKGAQGLLREGPRGAAGEWETLARCTRR